MKLRKAKKEGYDPKVIEALMIAFRNGTLDRPSQVISGL
jgi:hypothetical protein